jgi:hypothetical protein
MSQENVTEPTSLSPNYIHLNNQHVTFYLGSTTKVVRRNKQTNHVTLNENRTNIVTQALPAIGSSRFLAV